MRKTHAYGSREIAGGRGAHRFGRFRTLARPLPLTPPRLALSTLAFAGRPHTRASCALNWRAPRPPALSLPKQNKCSVLKARLHRTFFHMRKIERLPLILLETTQGFYFRADALSFASAPAPTLCLFVLVPRAPPAPLGAHFCFCLPARGGVVSFPHLFRGALPQHFSTCRLWKTTEKNFLNYFQIII
jgi:hypothetical protein